MRPRSMLFAIVCTLVLGTFSPATFAAQSEVFEVIDPGATGVEICKPAHRISDCSTFHPQGITVTAEGTIVDLDGRKYLLEWTGPGYYLESGVVLQPLGEAKAGLGGQRWLEVYPEQGKIHTSRSWQDQDGNRVLSVSDTLTLGNRKASRRLKVKDVRLQFRAHPLVEEPEEP